MQLQPALWYTVEPLLKDTPELKPLDQVPTSYKYVHVLFAPRNEDSSLIRTCFIGPRVSVLERIHCTSTCHDTAGLQTHCNSASISPFCWCRRMASRFWQKCKTSVTSSVSGSSASLWITLSLSTWPGEGRREGGREGGREERYKI